MKTIYTLFLFVLLTAVILPQGAVYKLTVTDSVDGTFDLKFGIDPQANEGIDLNMGESLLPPVPPPTVFEARFFLPMGEFSGDTASYKDIRNGSFPFTGTKEHRIRYQVGSGSKIFIIWDFPQNVTAVLQDVFTGTLINVNATGKGYTVIQDPAAFDQLKLIVTYNGIISDVKENSQLPDGFVLHQNYPNPFNPATTISFSLANREEVSLKVYDMLGNEVKTIAGGIYDAGLHSVSFSGAELASGVYLYRLQAGGNVLQKKMILIK